MSDLETPREDKGISLPCFSFKKGNKNQNKTKKKNPKTFSSWSGRVGSEGWKFWDLPWRIEVPPRSSTLYWKRQE